MEPNLKFHTDSIGLFSMTFFSHWAITDPLSFSVVPLKLKVVLLKIIKMTGFEPRITGVGSNCAANGDGSC